MAMNTGLANFARHLSFLPLFQGGLGLARAKLDGGSKGRN
jgi:hypothetical protein